MAALSLILLMLLWIPAAAQAAPARQAPSAAAQKPNATAQKIPPQSWTCPMHPDVVEDKPGLCPICKMKLEPVHLDAAWSCPVHTNVVETHEGQCPICKRPLVPITVSVFWTCEGSTVHEMSPGVCPDGSARVAARERRPHGDHNPRHGGVFFMAPDNWHHVEGTYPRDGVFRVFVYDDYTKPVRLAGVTGRAVTNATFNPALKQAREIEAYVLRPSRGQAYLEARIPSVALPAEVTAKIRFTAAGEEYRFDFVFPSYSKEPRRESRPSTTMTKTATPSTTPMTPVTPLTPATASGATTAPQATISGLAAGATAAAAAASPDLPGTTTGLLTELGARSRQVETLLLQGAFTEVYVPAMSAKDLALALVAHAGELPDDRRPRAASAARRVVLAAWQLDLYGDLGNRERLTESYQSFAAAVQDLTAAYEKTR